MGLSISLHLELLHMDLVHIVCVFITHRTEGSETKDQSQVVTKEALGGSLGSMSST